MALQDFRYVMNVRVPFYDVDMLQHVNHTAYIRWVETSRALYLEEVLGETITGRQSFILARLEIDYEEALDYREDVIIGCRVARIGRKSFGFVHEIWSKTHQKRAARGLAVGVAYDYEAKTSILVPKRWREVIAAYEVVAPTTGS
jgi:acyl-CoA thioester hydrolase